MCGRFSLMAVAEYLAERFDIEIHDTWNPRFNIAPTQMHPVVLQGLPNLFSKARWGLIPHWAKDEKSGYTMINARVESITEKNTYKSAFRSARCLVPADGFYEWKKTTSKVPFRITMKDNSVFAFAGLYEIWKNPDGIEVISFTIITLPPNDLVRPIHDRMPAILRREHEKLWLEDTTSEKLLDVVLKPYPAEMMKAFEISSLVNSPMADTAEVIQPLHVRPAKSLLDF